MAVYYKFKSAKDYDSVSLDGHFITVGNLKEKIFQSKHLGTGTDFDLVVSNAQTNEEHYIEKFRTFGSHEYVGEGMLIPKNTSVLIRRVPGRPRMPIVTAPVIDQQEPEVEYKAEGLQGAKSTFFGANPSVTKYPEESEWDEFGNDLYATPEVLHVQSSNQGQDAPPPSKADEDSKIQALIETPALDWQQQTADGFGSGRGYGRGMGSRMGGRGFGRGVGLDRKTPPPGYICHRCKVPGHFIQHCPTNGDPTFDVRKVKPPTGIPKSMLMATPDGSYALPSGAVAVLKPNEAAFEKEIEGMPSIRSVGDLPPELLCPMCGDVMKDAVLTSKCCFRSFCDKCIRGNIISKSKCVCGAQNVLADDLLPNKTVRDAINRILEANNSGGENKGSAFQIQDMESARPKPKIPSPAASKGEQILPQNKKTTGLGDTTEPVKIVEATQPPVQNLDIAGTARVPDVSEATNEPRNVKEPALQASGPLAAEDVPPKLASEPGKKKKKKKTRMPSEMQWNASQEFATDNYMMPMGPAFNPYWSGMQPGMEGFGGHFTGPMPYMGYGPGLMPLDVPYGGHFDPYGPPVNMMPFPPRRNFAGYGMGFNGGPPVMSKEEFEARKVDVMRRRGLERRRDSRDLPKGHGSREVTSSSSIPSTKLKSKSTLPTPSHADQLPDYPRNRLERSRSPRRHSRDPEPPRRHSRDPEPASRHSRDPEPLRTSSKRKAEDHLYNEDERRRHHHHHEKEHRRHRHHHHEEDHHHHISESLSSKPPMRPASTEPPPKSSRSSDKDKRSVFSRISFPEREAAAAAAKKRKSVASSLSPAVSDEYQEDHHKSRAAKAVAKKISSSTSGRNVEESYQYKDEYDESSEDDDRHFKRRPSRYVSMEEDRHSSRGSKEREKGSLSTKHSHSHK